MLSLWLMPDQETYLKLGQLIADLSSVHQTPSFEPHVTLLSGILEEEEVALQLTEELADYSAPIQSSLTRIEFLEYFYRCLFFRADTSKTLFALREEAEELFEHTKINPFVPHVSFLYGSLPVFRKIEIVEALGDRFFTDFTLTKLRLVRTELRPENWEFIGEFELEG